jgi:peptide/nickel transport system substrate-binding protein
LWFDFPIQPDINYSLRLYFQSDIYINYESYNNPEVDQLFQEGAPIVDPEERLAFHAPLLPILYKDAPLGWIAEPYYLIAMSDKLSGYGWYSTQHYRVYDMALAE